MGSNFIEPAEQFPSVLPGLVLRALWEVAKARLCLKSSSARDMMGVNMLSPPWLFLTRPSGEMRNVIQREGFSFHGTLRSPPSEWRSH